MTTNPKPKSEEGLIIWNAVCKAIEESKANWKESANDYEPISFGKYAGSDVIIDGLLNHIRYQMELAMRNFILLQDSQDAEDAENACYLASEFDEDTDPQYTEDPDAKEDKILNQITEFAQEISSMTDNLQDLRNRLKDQLDAL
jgi:hypothetical protein|tara:strand:+ start:881 stop:1312 length:432 start_codon:yes stop_codon:yes gene_type:complete